jgi:hypothetical protein
MTARNEPEPVNTIVMRKNPQYTSMSPRMFLPYHWISVDAAFLIPLAT